MILEAILILCVCGLLILDVALWRRMDGLMTAIARLARGQAEAEKFVSGMAKDFDKDNELLQKRVSEVESRVEELPVEKFRELAKQEAEFVDGLNSILNYSIDGHGLKDGVKHE